MTLYLAGADWRARAEAHEAAVDVLTQGHRARRAQGRAHPVEDFLFTYYRHAPSLLRRWHPGAGVVLQDASEAPHRRWRHYRSEGDEVALDTDSFVATRRDTVVFVRELLTATLSRPAHHGCFGLHEWAMAYRLPPGAQRHEELPLRLGAEGTDEVVEASALRCSHVDAFRFFTPDAVERNEVRPTRDRQPEFEQPGCLHAGMDVYKWAFKLAPAVPSELTLRCFELARRIRTLDMQASPYDVSGLGLEAVAIETPAGKAEYVRRQRAFTAESNVLRGELIAVCNQLLTADGSGDTVTGGTGPDRVGDTGIGARQASGAPPGASSSRTTDASRACSGVS